MQKHLKPILLLTLISCFTVFAQSRMQANNMLANIFDNNPAVSGKEFKLAGNVLDSLARGFLHGFYFRSAYSERLDKIMLAKNDSYYKQIEDIYQKNQPDSTAKPDQNILLLQILLNAKYYKLQLTAKPNLSGLIDAKTISAVKQLKEGLSKIESAVLKEIETKYLNNLQCQTLADKAEYIREYYRKNNLDTTCNTNMAKYSGVSAEFVQKIVFGGLEIPSEPQKTAEVIADFIKSKMKYSVLEQFSFTCLETTYFTKADPFSWRSFYVFADKVTKSAAGFYYGEFFSGFNLEKDLITQYQKVLTKQLKLQSKNKKYFLTDGKFNPAFKQQVTKPEAIEKYDLIIDSLRKISFDSSNYQAAFVKMVNFEDTLYQESLFNCLKKHIYARPAQYMSLNALKEKKMRDTITVKNSYDTGNPEAIIQKGVGVCRNFSAIMQILYKKAAELNPELNKQSRMTYAEMEMHAFNILYYINNKGEVDFIMLDLTTYIKQDILEMEPDPKKKKRFFEIQIKGLYL